VEKKVKTVQISFDELLKLKNLALEKKLAFQKVKGEHETMRIQEGSIDVIVYKSGSVVYRDNIPTEEFIFEALEYETGYDFLIGSDETGKGEWYGPLVVGALAATPEAVMRLRKLGVKDSKLLSLPKISEMASQIGSMSGVQFKSLVLLPKKYNDLFSEFAAENKNLNDLLAWAHSATIKELLSKLRFKQAKVVIDKFDAETMDLRLKTVDKSNLDIIQKSKGETEVPVASASIMAKMIFEREVEDLSKEYDVDLKASGPENVGKDVLPFVAKTHFKNVSVRLA
jgi:ribonuclease HIII